jgi:twitching motility protein PilT
MNSANPVLERFQKILDFGKSNKCSDIHLSSESKPAIRVDGEIIIMNDGDVLFGKDIYSIILSITNSRQLENYKKDFELDFSYFNSKNNLRYRVNSYITVKGPAIAFREIPENIPSFEDLSLPDSVQKLINSNGGLILVTGPTGSGKSTTIASLINHINQNQKKHIITIEDPVEFYHSGKLSIVNQREVKTHTKSFSSALRNALREDPDIILVGEMRDKETIELAINAAETGHLVFATLHTNSASQTVHRILNAFADDHKDSIRSSLASSLNAVISQRLFKKKNGGRCAAFEVMIVNNAIKNLVREDNIAQIDSMIEIGRKGGMSLMKDSIKNLFESGLISVETFKANVGDNHEYNK